MFMTKFLVDDSGRITQPVSKVYTYFLSIFSEISIKKNHKKPYSEKTIIFLITFNFNIVYNLYYLHINPINDNYTL